MLFESQVQMKMSLVWQRHSSRAGRSFLQVHKHQSSFEHQYNQIQLQPHLLARKKNQAAVVQPKNPARTLKVNQLWKRRAKNLPRHHFLRFPPPLIPFGLSVVKCSALLLEGQEVQCQISEGQSETNFDFSEWCRISRGLFNGWRIGWRARGGYSRRHKEYGHALQK